MLGRSGVLRDLVTHASRLKQIGLQLDACLPADVRPYYRLADLRDGVMILNAASPVWAARLRYLGPSILERMQRRCGTGAPHAIHVRVSLSDTRPEAKKPQRATMAPQTADFLGRVAQATTDPSLRAGGAGTAGRPLRGRQRP